VVVMHDGRVQSDERQTPPRAEPIPAGTEAAPVSPLQVLRVAVRALLRNKMRSFLTTLGVIIGVSA